MYYCLFNLAPLLLLNLLKYILLSTCLILKRLKFNRPQKIAEDRKTCNKSRPKPKIKVKALTEKALVVNNFSRSKLVFKFFLCIPSSLVGAVLTVV